jgi:hypothetical protein
MRRDTEERRSTTIVKKPSAPASQPQPEPQSQPQRQPPPTADSPRAEGKTLDELDAEHEEFHRDAPPHPRRALRKRPVEEETSSTSSSSTDDSDEDYQQEAEEDEADDAPISVSESHGEEVKRGEAESSTPSLDARDAAPPAPLPPKSRSISELEAKRAAKRLKAMPEHERVAIATGLLSANGSVCEVPGGAAAIRLAPVVVERVCMIDIEDLQVKGLNNPQLSYIGLNKDYPYMALGSNVLLFDAYHPRDGSPAPLHRAGKLLRGLVPASFSEHSTIGLWMQNGRYFVFPGSAPPTPLGQDSRFDEACTVLSWASSLGELADKIKWNVPIEGRFVDAPRCMYKPARVRYLQERLWEMAPSDVLEVLESMKPDRRLNNEGMFLKILETCERREATHRAGGMLSTVLWAARLRYGPTAGARGKSIHACRPIDAELNAAKQPFESGGYGLYMDFRAVRDMLADPFGEPGTKYVKHAAFKMKVEDPFEVVRLWFSVSNSWRVAVEFGEVRAKDFPHGLVSCRETMLQERALLRVRRGPYRSQSTIQSDFIFSRMASNTATLPSSSSSAAPVARPADPPGEAAASGGTG